MAKTPAAKTSDSSPLDTEETIAIEEKTLARVLESIRNVNAKVPPACAVALAMMGSLPAFVHTYNFPAPLALILGSAGPLVCLVLCVLIVLPQTDSSNRSFLFFGTIAKLKKDEYQKEVTSRTETEYLEDLCHQVHRNSEIAWDKHTYMKWAMVALFLGMPAWLAAAYWLANVPVPVPHP